jgi:pimeloyl-ACP methyl ester carboxylesterase
MWGRIANAVLQAAGLALALSAAPWPLRAELLPVGKSEREIRVGETAWRVHAYKADCYRDGVLVMVFHGSDRNPELARDNAIPLAEAGCALVVAPFFDSDRFPRWAYHFGGLGDLVEENGSWRFQIRSEERRTGRLVLALIDALREGEDRPRMPYSLIGHSAGAQFLGRFAAFYPNEAHRIVLANAGSYVAPTWEHRFPYGFGGLILADDAERRRYLASPIVILLATRDVSREGLDKSPGAELQGSTRHERGIRVFHQAEATAVLEGMPFGWSLIEVPGLGHGSRALYARPETASSLFEP